MLLPILKEIEMS